ncbi:MAG: hypothetical protein ACJ8AT_09395 [Hyalangium sp.]|uniref:hypothetical protein n=1 Tax=Hyalangium sp. TaxID=2028555 RepID=UPI00389A0A58
MAQDSGKTPRPNDQRSNAKNPTSHEKKAADDNRSNQMNPEHPAHPSQQQDKKG